MNKKKRLFRVRVSWDVVVHVRDADEAVPASLHAVEMINIGETEYGDAEPEWTVPIPIDTITELPAGWTGDCIPHGMPEENDEQDRTINQILRRQ